MIAFFQRCFPFALGAAATLAAVPALAVAETAPAPAAPPTPTAVAAPLPGNDARCVYDYMTAEDREMALLLLAREITDGGRFRKSSRNVIAVDRLIEDAHRKCLARFKWTAGRSDAATGYALAAILAEALSQAIDSFGHPLAPVDAYYSANRARLTGPGKLAAADRDQFTLTVREQGWETADEAEISLAILYVETRLLQDQARRQFALHSAPARQPIRRQPYRAGKAKRGTP